MSESSQVSVGVYGRMSEDRSGEAAGVARQEADCRALAERRGWRVARVYIDNDVSAYMRGKKRPEWLAMLDDLRAGRIGGIVAYDLDRVARRMTDLEDLLSIYESHPALVYAGVTGEIDLATSGGQLVARMLVAVATKSSKDTSRRVARERVESAKAGKPNGGRRPYGYEKDQVTVRESEAAVIREAAARVITGTPIHAIVCDFNARGIPATSGGRWQSPPLRAILTSERVAGRRVFQKRTIGEAAWPAILDADTWDAVHATLATRGHRPTYTARKYLLSGLAFCGRCGAALNVRSAKPDEVAAYVCPAKAQGGCGGISRHMHKVDALVSAAVLARLAGSQSAPRTISPDTDSDIAELTRLRGRLDGLAVAFADDKLTAEQLHSGSSRLRERITALESSVALATRGTVLGIFAGVEDVASVWDGLGLTQRRAVIDSLMTITILPSKSRGGAGFDRDSVRLDHK